MIKIACPICFTRFELDSPEERQLKQERDQLLSLLERLHIFCGGHAPAYVRDFLHDEICNVLAVKPK
jgi:hypothetical protein